MDKAAKTCLNMSNGDGRMHLSEVLIGAWFCPMIVLHLQRVELSQAVSVGRRRGVLRSVCPYCSHRRQRFFCH